MKTKLTVCLSFAALMACGVAGVSLAKDAPKNGRLITPQEMAEPDLWPMDTPLPQDAMLVPDIGLIVEKKQHIQMAMVTVEMGHRNENPRWMMSQTQLQVFLSKLGSLPDKPLPEDDIWPKLKPLDPTYKGISIALQTELGKRFAPMRVFEGRITDPNGKLLSPDYARNLEYWLFGTARVRRDQMLGVNVLPVISFEQCRLLGQQVVQTVPRQCLLPNNNLLLEVSDMPTLKSARIKDFDQCLRDGVSLIYTFPRRCVAAGGRVFTEPPRVYDEFIPADAPLAESPTEKVDATTSAGGLKMAVPQGVVTPTVPVSGTQALNDAELRSIEPAAGPHKGPNFFQRWIRDHWKPEFADFGK